MEEICVEVSHAPWLAFALRASPRQPCHDKARRAEAGAACEGWWSQAGSNRRPRHCERRALPAELWPLSRTASNANDGGLQSGVIYNPRQGQVKNGEKRRFPVTLSGLPLFAGDGTGI